MKVSGFIVLALLLLPSEAWVQARNRHPSRNLHPTEVPIANGFSIPEQRPKRRSCGTPLWRAGHTKRLSKLSPEPSDTTYGAI
jgi:hypothetical protein